MTLIKYCYLINSPYSNFVDCPNNGPTQLLFSPVQCPARDRTLHAVLISLRVPRLLPVDWDLGVWRGLPLGLGLPGVSPCWTWLCVFGRVAADSMLSSQCRPPGRCVLWFGLSCSWRCCFGCLAQAVSVKVSALRSLLSPCN